MALSVETKKIQEEILHQMDAARWKGFHLQQGQLILTETYLVFRSVSNTVVISRNDIVKARHIGFLNLIKNGFAVLMKTHDSYRFLVQDKRFWMDLLNAKT